jgi:hypothetical protein
MNTTYVLYEFEATFKCHVFVIVAMLSDIFRVLFTNSPCFRQPYQDASYYRDI